MALSALELYRTSVQRSERRAEFLTELDLTPMPDGNTWRVNKPLVFYSAVLRREVRVPAGFTTDLASIPALERIGAAIILFGHFSREVLTAWTLPLMWVGLFLCFLSKCLRPYGKYTWAAVVHDYLYRIQNIPRNLADAVMWEGMISRDTEPWKRVVIYCELRRWGWCAWMSNRWKAAAATVAGTLSS